MPHKEPKGSLAVAYGVHKRQKMAKGGKASHKAQKGVHHPISRGDAGTSDAGAHIGGHGYGNNPSTAKRIHKETLEESRAMPSPKLKGLAHGGMYAEGGQIEDNYQSSCTELCNSPCEIHPEASGFVEHEGNNVKHNGSAMSESARKLGQHGEDEQGPYSTMMATGGFLEGPDRYPKNKTPDAMDAGSGAPAKDDLVYKAQLKRIAEQEKMRRKTNPEEYEKVPLHAEGGFITDNKQSEEHEMDMVGRIMAKRQNHYSEGGRVANNAHEFEYEFETPNEFDDLVLRDDLESTHNGDNAGDHLGNAGEDKRRKDIVSRVMRSRRLKDRNPNPA